MKRTLTYHFGSFMIMVCMLAQAAFAQTSATPRSAAPAPPAEAIPSVSGKRIWDMSRITDREAGKKIKASETFDQLLQLSLPAAWKERINKELDQMAEDF